MTEETIYCPKCGFKNLEDSSFCGMCGNSLSSIHSINQSTGDAQRSTQIKQTSGFAIVSLILGILSLVTVLSFSLEKFTFPVAAIIFGAVAINQTKSNSKHRRRGIAIAGFCLGILGLIILTVSFIATVLTGPVEY